MTVSANFLILKDTEKLGYAFNKVHVWVISRHTAISLFETILINFKIIPQILKTVHKNST